MKNHCAKAIIVLGTGSGVGKSFIAPFRLAQDPNKLETLAEGRTPRITSATAFDLGLLGQLFRTYAIVSQAA